jgi:hypothetical protein
MNAPAGNRITIDVIPHMENTLHIKMSVFDRPYRDDERLSKAGVNVIETENTVQLGLIERETPPR